MYIAIWCVAAVAPPSTVHVPASDVQRVRGGDARQHAEATAPSSCPPVLVLRLPKSWLCSLRLPRAFSCVQTAAALPIQTARAPRLARFRAAGFTGCGPSDMPMGPLRLTETEDAAAVHARHYVSYGRAWYFVALD
jgi:hypothetical protein